MHVDYGDMYSDDMLLPWHEAVLGMVPGIQLFDAHTHTGSNDPDGNSCSAEDLIAGLELAGARAVVFTMHEPDGYGPANDRIIEEAAASEGRLVPFCRLDPAADPLREAERALGRGARGIKQHPRAEEFPLDDERLEPVFALADERRLPIIVHAGRGIPALGRDALEITGRHSGLRLILAHDGVCDLAWIWRHAPDHPNLFFDTAWWSTLDHLSLFGLVPPGQILFASDMPYGTTVLQSILALRCAFQAGLSEEQVREIAAGQLERILAGDEPLDLGPPPGDGRLAGDLLLERVHTYLITATGRMMIRDKAPDYLGLARLACDMGDDAPQAPVCKSILALLDGIEDYVAKMPEPSRVPTDAAAPRPPFPGVGLAVVAATIALTPDVPLPELPEPVEVGERSED
jgi:predicted TIM-barrel fold metal-dependent hydrolase